MPELGPALHDLIEGSLSSVHLDAIVATRRRRRTRRRVGVAAAVVVLAAVVTGSVLARPAREPKVIVANGAKPVAEADATRAALHDVTILSPTGDLLGTTFAKNGAVSVTDPVSGVTRKVNFPVSGVQVSSRAFAVGSNLVMVLTANSVEGSPAGSVYVVSAALDQWQAIGSGSAVLAARDPDHLWVVAQDGVSEQTIEGQDRSPSYPLSDARTPLAAVTGGLLTTRPGVPNSGQEILEVWDPASNHVVRRLDAGASLVAADGDHIVWDACAKSCFRHVLDLRTGTDRVLAAPPGMGWNEAALSPDGRQLAMVAHTPLTRREAESQSPFPPPGMHASIVSVFDLSSGKETERNVSTWKGATPVAWSPDGSLLFFGRDASHVDYFNTTYAGGPVRDLAVPGADGFLLATKPVPSKGTQQYEYDGLISQSREHSPELCLYATTKQTLAPGSDACSGPLVSGLDWSKAAAWETTANGVTSANLRVVGTYDGHTFTLTQPAGPARSTPPVPTPSFKSACAPPAGGWRITNSARLTFDDYLAMTNGARAAPDFAGLWIDSSTAPPGSENDFPHEVFNIAFTGNIEAHRAAMAALWGGPICVVQRPHSYAQLESISTALFGAAGRDLGLQMLGGGPDDFLDVVTAEVIAATPATQRAVDARFGKGVVVLQSRLRPVA